MCDDATPINLNSGIPVGGTYTVNGNNATFFTPSTSNIDTNTIQISKFSSQWRLRPISFEDSNALLFHRITTKGNI